jgi:repressor of nif and glnA expression
MEIERTALEELKIEQEDRCIEMRQDDILRIVEKSDHPLSSKEIAEIYQSTHPEEDFSSRKYLQAAVMLRLRSLSSWELINRRLVNGKFQYFPKAEKNCRSS